MKDRAPFLAKHRNSHGSEPDGEQLSGVNPLKQYQYLLRLICIVIN